MGMLPHWWANYWPLAPKPRKYLCCYSVTTNEGVTGWATTTATIIPGPMTPNDVERLQNQLLDRGYKHAVMTSFTEYTQ